MTTTTPETIVPTERERALAVAAEVLGQLVSARPGSVELHDTTDKLTTLADWLLVKPEPKNPLLGGATETFSLTTKDVDPSALKLFFGPASGFLDFGFISEPEPVDPQAVPDPDADAVYVFDTETLRSLPEGTRFGGRYNDPDDESGLGPLPVGEGILNQRLRRIFNPEILGEFKPVTHLEGREDFDRAPIGTVTERKGEKLTRIRPGRDGWQFEGGGMYGSSGPFLRREILRWGPPTELVTEQDYADAPVGTIVKRHFDWVKGDDAMWRDPALLDDSGVTAAMLARDPARKVARWGAEQQ